MHYAYPGGHKCFSTAWRLPLLLGPSFSNFELLIETSKTLYIHGFLECYENRASGAVTLFCGEGGGGCCCLLKILAKIFAELYVKQS